MAGALLNRTRTSLAVGLAVCLLIPVAAAAGREVSASAALPPAHLRQAPGFHHVHLNVTDPAASQAYYEKFFGALPIRYRDRSDALFTERSFILLNVVDQPPRDNFGTTFWHIGWAGVHGPTEFEWRVAEGAEVQTPITPLGRQHYMYFWGPDRELVEVFTGSRNHRFEHVHLLATDIQATVDWFRTHFDIEPTGPVRIIGGTSVPVATFRIDNVNMIIFEVGAPDAEAGGLLPPGSSEEFEVTDGRAMDHFAFSYPEILPVLQRLAAAGVEIVRPIAVDPGTGLTSFFARGPDGLLLEIVEERPVPAGIWR